MHLITNGNTGHVTNCIVVEDKDDLLGEVQRFCAETGTDLSQVVVNEITGPKYHVMLTIADLGPDLESPDGRQSPMLGR
jgi:hypothetical protein